jgi:predicted phosphate transport protein (TIGR00153 family)
MADFFDMFTSTKKKFIPLFENSALNLVESAKTLLLMVQDTTPESRKKHYEEIEKLEHIGDGYTHNIFTELGETSVTPFDRKDIRNLASALDDVVDFIQGSAKKIEVYKIKTPEPYITRFAVLIDKCAAELLSAVRGINLKDVEGVRSSCIRINSHENQADDALDTVTAIMFAEWTDAIEIIKMREVYYMLEMATDKCEDAANVLESIALSFRNSA